MIQCLQRSYHGLIAKRGKTIVETFYKGYYSQELNFHGYGRILHTGYSISKGNLVNALISKYFNRPYLKFFAKTIWLKTKSVSPA